jgi:hypothetical protein
VTDQRFIPPPIRDPAYAPQQPFDVEMPGATKSEATTVFVLGLLGVIVCSLLAPFAWKKGNTYMAVCMIHGIQPEGLAVAGRILGIFGSVILALTVVSFFFGACMGIVGR